MKNIQEKKFILNTSQYQTASTNSTNSLRTSIAFTTSTNSPRTSIASTTFTNSPNRTSMTSTASTNSLTHLNRKTLQPESIKSISKKITSANIAAMQEQLRIIRIPESIKLAKQDQSSSNATTKDLLEGLLFF